jgi:acetylornithine/N-succinyldiaminopimelate aminotransferase
MEEDGLLENAHSVGEYLVKRLGEGLRHQKGFLEIRGKGLMLGIVLDRPCPEVVKLALDAGLVLNVTADSVIRLLPPLIFTRAHADILVERLLPIIHQQLA